MAPICSVAIDMELLTQAQEGFQTVPVEAGVKEQALKHLRQWLTEAEFAAYRPQIEWLITEKQCPGLLDRFYQILPFATARRRGALAIAPPPTNLSTLRHLAQAHCT